MTGYTPNVDLPFPDDYNAPADVPTDVEALAQATDSAIANRVAHGTTPAARVIGWTGTPSPTLGGVTVVIPGGGFTTPPTVTVTVGGSGAGNSAPAWCSVHSVTATTFKVKYFNVDGEIVDVGPWSTHFIAVGT